MNAEPTFDQLITEAMAAPFEGWDFSWLDGRRTDCTLPWDYRTMAKAAMSGIESMLDMGTGGGEVLASLAPLPPRTCAIETYPPNVIIARDRLAPLGVDLRDTSNDPENLNLPFSDATFDLVINRHESYIPAEVFRILTPDGRFITQQCGGYGESELIEFFKGKDSATTPMDWTAAVATRQLAEAGFQIVDSREACQQYEFLDVGAVVYTLKAIPWIVDDFAVESYRHRLLAMHEHIRERGSFPVTASRFCIEACKPR